MGWPPLIVPVYSADSHVVPSNNTWFMKYISSNTAGIYDKPPVYLSTDPNSKYSPPLVSLKRYDCAGPFLRSSIIVYTDPFMLLVSIISRVIVSSRRVRSSYDQ